MQRKVSARRDREVLEAAAKVFYQRGYMNARVEDIAAELGLLKGSLYHYIEGKEDVLFRLLDETHDEVHRILDDVAALPELSPLERLHEYVRRQVEFNMENLVRVSVYYHDLNCLAPARLAEIVSRRRQHERFVLRMIETAQRSGEVDPGLEAEVLSKCVFATIVWTYHWYSPSRDAERSVDRRCADYVVAGLVGAAVGAAGSYT